tara:strand:+ start:136 stop:357 length:222 start_codon:yes stop_codon:yes gene_type:complete
MKMTEVFLINYATIKRPTEDLQGWLNNETGDWTCHHMTHSLAVATEKAQELRDTGYRVNVQSILLNENGKVRL